MAEHLLQVMRICLAVVLIYLEAHFNPPEKRFMSHPRCRLFPRG